MKFLLNITTNNTKPWALTSFIMVLFCPINIFAYEEQVIINNSPSIVFLGIGLILSVIYIWQLRKKLRSHKILLNELQEINTAYTNESSENPIFESDMLTGLPGRKQLFDHLENVNKSKPKKMKQYALMLIDLDFFRSFNSNLGHDAGDAILIECADRLMDIFSETCYIARVHGDEFAVVFDVENKQDIESTANKIIDVMRQPLKISGQDLYISVSIGIAVSSDNTANADTFIRNAVSAVNMVKHTRRNSFMIHNEEISKFSHQKFNVHTELRQALKNNEFVLHYQPKIDGKNNFTVGIEALIRWNHPTRGLLYPIDFIPIAEETGIIKQIDEWVLNTACTQLKQWNQEGINNMRLAVNLSAWQFKDHHLVDTVARVLQTTGVPPTSLELEITETVAIENLNFTQNILTKLIEMGVSISIDDFGTGYSSLYYLKHFPINFVKIDRSFVADILTDQNTCSIVGAIIDIAHALQLKVIAEGVENQEQLDILNKLGCDEIQGYLISKPLPVDGMNKHFKSMNL